MRRAAAVALLLLQNCAALRQPTRLAATKGFNFDVASWLKAPTTTIHEDVDDVDESLYADYYDEYESSRR